jgi:multiple sugar transport system permease protein
MGTGRWLRYTVLLLFAILFVFPLLIFVLTTTRSHFQLAMEPMGFGSLGNIVTDWKIVSAYGDGVFLIWLRNSIFVSLGGTVLAVFAGLPAGYALACLRFRLRQAHEHPRFSSCPLCD